MAVVVRDIGVSLATLATLRSLVADSGGRGSATLTVCPASRGSLTVANLASNLSHHRCDFLSFVGTNLSWGTDTLLAVEAVLTEVAILKGASIVATPAEFAKVGEPLHFLMGDHPCHSPFFL